MQPATADIAEESGGLFFIRCERRISMSKKTRRLTAFLMCVFLCLILAFTFRYMILESNHHCTGKDCPICMEIHICVSLQNTIGSGVIFPAAIAAAVLAFATKKYARALFEYRYQTLVSLKVKLTD